MEKTVVLGGTASNKRKQQYRAYIWLAPALLLLLIFCYIPPILSLILSFTDSRGNDLGNFIKLANYINLLTDKLFWKSLLNVFLTTAWGMVFGNIANILLAELVYHVTRKKLAGAYRFLFIVPLLVPGIVGMLIWRHIVFAPTASGVVNSFFSIFGIKPQGWYFDEKTALISIMLTGFPYGGGIPLLIFLAGLNNISTEMIEATQLEGLSAIKRVFYIDLPHLFGQIKFSLITGVIGGLQNFTFQLLFTYGGPGVDGATLVPGYMIYELAFTKDKYGLASANGMIIFIITMVLTVINMKIMKNKDMSEEVV